jgi:hypothetical protein
MELWTQLRPRTRWGMKIGTLRIAFTAERGFFVRSRHASRSRAIYRPLSIQPPNSSEKRLPIARVPRSNRGSLIPYPFEWNEAAPHMDG